MLLSFSNNDVIVTFKFSL